MNIEKFINNTEPNLVDFKWSNRFNCGEEIINHPITLEGKIVGCITDVDKDYVYGRSFFDALPELNLNQHTVISFEFSDSWIR